MISNDTTLALNSVLSELMNLTEIRLMTLNESQLRKTVFVKVFYGADLVSIL